MQRELFIGVIGRGQRSGRKHVTPVIFRLVKTGGARRRLCSSPASCAPQTLA